MARKPNVDWITIGAAAKILGCTYQNMHKHVRLGRLPNSQQIDGAWLIYKPDFERFRKLRDTGAFRRVSADKKCD